ncbi:hypothetical protein P9112_006365 [Eukaryota sp. TZLM1-RC]
MAKKQWKQEDTILMFGDNHNNSKNSKHHRSSRCVGWRNFLKRNDYTICLVDECKVSNLPVNVFLDVKNSIPWMRKNYPTVKCHALLRCRSDVGKECDGKDKVWNRNKLACINIKALVDYFVEDSVGDRSSYLSQVIVFY